jgi:cytochrome P450
VKYSLLPNRQEGLMAGQTTQTQPAASDNVFGSIFENLQGGGSPFPMFQALRKTAPVMKLPGDFNFWGVFRYDDCVRILRDPQTFSSMVDSASMRGERRPPTILFDDPPVHTRMRGLLTKAFTPRVIEEQRDAIRTNATRMIDGMLREETPDLIAHLAYPLPVMVIAGMLGVEGGNMATFKRWSDAIIQNVGNALVSETDDDPIAEVNAEFNEYFGERLRELRANPEANLLSELVHATGEDGQQLTEEDLLIVCRVLLVAGNETTTGLIVNAIRVFDEFPQVLTTIRERPELIPSMIEETLRYYPPFPATIRRAVRDVEVAGTTIPKDSRILVMLASANHDENAFEQAEEFVIDRAGNRHLGFGMGIHFCLGAPLARLEGNVAMEILAPRITSLKIEETEEDAVLRPGGPAKMLVRYERDRAFAAV